MPKRIALVDKRPDMLAFMCEKISERGYEVATVFTEADAEALIPPPDVTLVDFEEFSIDLADVFGVIEEALAVGTTSALRRSFLEVLQSGVATLLPVGGKGTHP